MKQVIFDSRKTTDGYLDSQSGRIVIFHGVGLASRGNGRDHNDLLRALARQNGFDVHKVISNGIRMYYTLEDDKIYISERREIDYQEMAKNFNYYAKIINEALKK